jgi:hypothetical protein
VRFDSRGQNQVRCISTVETAGAEDCVAYAEYWDGAAWVTPGVDDTEVPVTLGSTGPHPDADEGWVLLTPDAIGDKLWRGMVRGGDDTMSPSVSKFHLQFRNASAPTTDVPIPPGISPVALYRWTPTEGAGNLVTNKISPGDSDLHFDPSFPPDWVLDGRVAYHCWDNIDSRLPITFAGLSTELRTSACMFYIRPTTMAPGGGGANNFHILAIGHRQGGAPGSLDGNTPELSLRANGAFRVDMSSSTSGSGAIVDSSVLLEIGTDYTVGYVHNGSTLTVYVNGVACGSAACALGIDWVLLPTWFIGCPHGNFTDRRTNEDIGDFILWDGGITGTGLPTAAEMLHNHQELRDTLYPGLP